jgi:hypothetical protein
MMVGTYPFLKAKGAKVEVEPWAARPAWAFVVPRPVSDFLGLVRAIFYYHRCFSYLYLSRVLYIM